jgi:hypothetical protein
MFIGHFAVGFAAKKAAPKISLGTLFLAAQFLDILFPLFLLAGVEHVRLAPGITAVVPLDFTDYPLSHSLAAALFWALAFGGVYGVIRRSRTGAWVVAACVLSHWILDLATHRHDLQLWPGSDAVAGLGLWDSLPGTLVIELGLFVTGVVIYNRTTRARDRVGVYALWSLCLVLVGIYVSNLLGPPPPSVGAIAVAGNLGWIFILWGYWIDRHRTSSQEIPRGTS